MSGTWKYEFEIEVKQGRKTTTHQFYGTEKKAREYVLNKVLKGKIGSAEFVDFNGGAYAPIVGKLWNEDGKWYYCDAWSTYRVSMDGSVRFISKTTKIKNDGW